MNIYTSEKLCIPQHYNACRNTVPLVHQERAQLFQNVSVNLSSQANLVQGHVHTRQAEVTLSSYLVEADWQQVKKHTA